MRSDEQLLAAWRGGDRRAGNELFSRHFRSLERFFANKLDSQEHEELIQQTFAACVHGVDRFEGRASFKSYLLGIARNMVRKHWERRSRRTTPIDELSLAELGAGPSSLLARDRAERRLLEALRRIPLGQQEILELYYWEELTAGSIAELLDLPEDTARSRLRRAKLALGREFRRLERFVGEPESTEQDLEGWARGLRGRLLTGEA